MRNIVKRASAGAVVGGSLLFAGMGVAGAQPLNVQDGLVNVGVGDVTILEDVNVAVAAEVIAAICGTDVTAAVLGEVDQTGDTQTFCDVPGGDINVTQNAGTPGESGQAPGGGPAQAPGEPAPGGPNQ